MEWIKIDPKLTRCW
jgi:hypothetical protein